MKWFAKRITLVGLFSVLLLVAMAGFDGSAPRADDDHGPRRIGFHLKADQKDRGGKDHGNETTGEIAAWLFGIANVTVALSLLSRVAGAVAGSEPLKSAIKQFNRRQKKLLLPLHYVLNPIAVLTAALHFSLSSCRSTNLPEWTLLGLLTLVALGLAIKFKWAPRTLRPRFYALHTHPLLVTTAFLLLFIGHQLMD